MKDDSPRSAGQAKGAPADSLLPICTSCKKIRDDKGYWHQVESCMRDHVEVEFSHGLCPERIRRLYPDLAEG